jgi:hypothetical protein
VHDNPRHPHSHNVSYHVALVTTCARNNGAESGGVVISVSVSELHSCPDNARQGARQNVVSTSHVTRTCVRYPVHPHSHNVIKHAVLVTVRIWNDRGKSGGDTISVSVSELHSCPE